MSDSAKNVWGLDDAALIRAEHSAKRFKLKHGMFAGIPLICKKDKCPYANVCTLPDQHRVLGSRCSIEIGAIMTRFEAWCSHFEVEADGEYIRDEDLVDATLIRDLVDVEVQILRAENRMAISGDFIGKTISTIDKNGKAYYEDTVSPEAEFKMTLLDKRYKVLQLLNSTRKDKARIMKNANNPSETTIKIFNTVKEKMNGIDLSKMDDSDFEDV